jgi:hypothetical protein
MPQNNTTNRISTRIERVLYGRILGLAPDPETWPPPDNVSSLPVPDGLEKFAENLSGWVLEPEFGPRWPRRRTVIGAHAYRLEENAEYDCGWRLVDVAARFLRPRLLSHPDIVSIVPPPQLFQAVHSLEWAGERLAHSLDSTFRPDLFTISAPLNGHADRLAKLPAPWGGLYGLARPESVFNKNILLIDWRWEKGKSLWALSKLLRDAGAPVVCFAWMG